MKFKNIAKEGLLIGKSLRVPGEFELDEPLSERVQAQVDFFKGKGALEVVVEEPKPEIKPETKPEPEVKPEPEPKPEPEVKKVPASSNRTRGTRRSKQNNKAE